MKFRSMGYCFIQGLKNITRNRVFSMASVATMALCIFILGLFYSVTTNVNYMVDQMSETLYIQVFFDDDINEERIESIGNTIESRDEVTYMEYTSAEEAWNEYKEKYFGEDYAELAEGYADDNPLANSASYEVYFKEATQQNELVTFVEGIDGVRKVNSSDVTADSLSEISSLVGLVSIAILLILLGIALFLINNTIAIGITVRNEEIRIMRLLGARNAFIRAPFVVEGVLIGMVGAAIPLAAVYLLYGNVVTYVMSQFSFLSNILVFMPVEELFKTFVPMSLALGVGLGLLGSIVSLRRHMRE